VRDRSLVTRDVAQYSISSHTESGLTAISRKMQSSASGQPATEEAQPSQ